MPTLEINGKRVQVDDSFLSLSPEQQEATVDEIAAQIGAPSESVADKQPASSAPSGRHLSYEEGLAELEKERLSGRSGEFGAGSSSFFEDIPVIGPAILGGAQRVAAGISSLIDGEDYETNLKQGRLATEAAQEANPVASVAGGVAGNLAALGAGGSTALGARALGITGPNLAARAGASALSSGALAGADSLARGGDGADAAANAGFGAAIGGAIPVVGAGLQAGARAIGNRVYPVINAVRNPEGEAARRLGMAVTRDAAANPGSVMSATDEVIARQNNIPVVNADRGGETTRALARSVANQSPEARGVIEKTASDRFGDQSKRAADFVRRIAGGNADDLATQQAMRDAARRANKPAYDRAFGAPEAQAMWTPTLSRLMEAPAMKAAARTATTRGANRAAAEGFKPITNPFTIADDGTFSLRVNPNGTTATPTLQFWDQVKQNLDGMIGKAQRAGDRPLVSDLMSLKTKLVDELDNTVGSYKAARQGAAAFFGAEDALEAGKKFATTPRLVPEAKQAFKRFTPAEKEAFATGYASELIDRIKASGDRTNVINSVFKSQSARESMELVFGAQKAKEIEAYVRVEDLVDRIRGAMGNSTTARQLVELGIGAGGGYATTGDWTGALTGAALARGARSLGQRVDAKVMERVANMLMSDNKNNITMAVQVAARNPAYMGALERLGSALAVPSRVAGSISVQ